MESGKNVYYKVVRFSHIKSVKTSLIKVYFGKHARANKSTEYHFRFYLLIPRSKEKVKKERFLCGGKINSAICRSDFFPDRFLETKAH